MSYDPRPHLPPCKCPACEAWAKSIVATPSPERKQSPEPGRDISLAEFARNTMALACRATGMTEAQLRAYAESQEIELLDVEAIVKVGAGGEGRVPRPS